MIFFFFFLSLKKTCKTDLCINLSFTIMPPSVPCPDMPLGAGGAPPEMPQVLSQIS